MLCVWSSSSRQRSTSACSSNKYNIYSEWAGLRGWTGAMRTAENTLPPNFGDPLKGELRRISLLKLSEKGYEQHSDRGFGWYTEGEMYEKTLIGGPQGYAASA